MIRHRNFFLSLVFASAVFLSGAELVLAQAPSCTGVCRVGKCESGESQPPGETCSLGALCCKSSTPSSGGGLTDVQLTNPLKYDSVEAFVSAVLVTIQGIVATLAVLAIVIGGVIYIISAGNSTLMTQAKGAITGALVGLALVIAAPSFLKEIYDILGAKSKPGEVEKALSLTQIAMNVLDFILSIIGVLAVIMLIIGGLVYLTSAGDTKRIETGRNIVKYALIGITVALASLILIRTVEGLLQ